MKRQHMNKPMPIVAMVGLCFSLLAFAFTVVAASSMSLGVALVGFGVSIAATVAFGGVVFAWVVA